MAITGNVVHTHFWRDALTSAAVGGAAGAASYAVFAIVASREPIYWGSLALLVGWSLTTIGWIVAQQKERKFYIHKLRDAARLETLKAIRHHQSVLRHIQVRMLNTPNLQQFLDNEETIRWI